MRSQNNPTSLHWPVMSPDKQTLLLHLFEIYWMSFTFCLSIAALACVKEWVGGKRLVKSTNGNNYFVLKIHVLENGEIHIYSRNQENNTSKYPDIIERMPKVGIFLPSLPLAMLTYNLQIMSFSICAHLSKKM